MIRCFASSKKVCTVVEKGEMPKVGKDEFVCLFIEKPTEEEIGRICKTYKFNKKYFSTYTKELRSMRYTMDPLVFVFIDYYVEGDDIRITPTLFMMKQNVLVVAIPHKSKFYSDLFASLASRLEEEEGRNNLGYLLYYFLYEDARENYEVLDKIEDSVQAIEETVRRPEIKPKFIDEIVRLKRRCFKMSKHLWASAKVIYTIKRGLTPLTLEKELLTLLDDVYDTLVHQIDLLTVQREILTDLLEIYATMINNRLTVISNELSGVMKKLTSLTVIIAIPTLIASFYGMNFRNMPELNIPHASIIFWSISLFSMIIPYYLFHKKGWI